MFRATRRARRATAPSCTKVPVWSTFVKSAVRDRFESHEIPRPGNNVESAPDERAGSHVLPRLEEQRGIGEERRRRFARSSPRSGRHPRRPTQPQFAEPATHHRAIEPSSRKEPAMPIVTVQQSPRDLELKRRLVAGITQAFVDAYDARPEHVQVFIHENWAKAGKLAADG